MTDPFSVGAGAVGVISLGITVCQGLVTYYSRFTEYDPETKSFVKKTEGLNATLVQLDSLLKSIQRPLSSDVTDEIDIVTQRIEDCKHELHSLSERLTKCRGCDPAKTVQKDGWYHARKLLYPFKRGTIVALIDTVSGLLSNLDTALQILNLAVSKQIENQTTLTLSLSQSMTAVATDNSATLSRIEQTQQQMYQDQQQLYQAILSAMQSTSITSTSTAITRKQSLSPATLQSFCDQQQTVNSQYKNRPLPVRRRPKHNAGSCTCSRKASAAGNIFQILQSHEFGCPLYFQEHEMTVFQKKFSFCNRFLGRSIYLSFNASAAAGTFTIKPSFGIRRVVPEDAPAFRFVSDIATTGSIELTYNLDSVVRDFYNIFRDGKASPRDTLSGGETILHFAVKQIGISRNIGRHLSAYIRFLQSMIELCHVSVNEEWRGDTVLDALITVYGFNRLTDKDILLIIPMISAMFSYGGEVTDVIFEADDDNYGLYLPGEAYLHFSRILPLIVDELKYQDLALSDVDIAIMQRSKQDLQKLATLHTGDRIQIRSAIVMSMVQWSHGLEIILNSPAFRVSRSRAILLGAIMNRQHESVQLLLTHGWRIDSFSLRIAAKLAYEPHIFQIIADHLAKRRRHLLHLARANLRPELLNDLRVSEHTNVLDCHRERLENELSDYAEVDFNEGFPVYQHISGTTRAAETLYKAGFTNVEAGDLSPFLAADIREPLEYFNYCSWLQNKGASIYRRSQNTDILPVHHIMREIGWFLEVEKAWEDLNTECPHHLQLLRDILTDRKHRDSCSCACSENGCLPSNIFLKEIIENRERGHQVIAEFINNWGSLDPDSARKWCESLAPVVFRSLLFDELELTHTCGDHYYRLSEDYEEEEIRGIQLEEQYLIDRLEELVLEVEAKYKELGAPLQEFLTGYFDSKLKELCEEEEVYDEEEARRMRSVGVILE